MDDRLADLEAQLQSVQKEIRRATRQRAAIMNEGRKRELAAVADNLATLREQRQALLDEQLRLRRQEHTEASVAQASSLPPVAHASSVRARGRPPLVIRLATTLLVFAAVAVVLVGALIYAAERFLVPPPIEGATGET
ncbi:MAG: hypothetical protein ACRDIB_11120, partial [Ardenticatenaceae bacterium]